MVYKTPLYKPQTKKAKIFVAEYMSNGGDEDEAYTVAGYSDAGHGTTNPRQLLRKYRPYISELTKEMFDIEAGGAAQRIVELSRESKNETVKFKANQDILSRAGFDAVQKAEVKDTTEDMSDEELTDRIVELSGGADIVKLTPVDSTGEH